MKSIWVNREGLLRNRATGMQYGDPAICVNDGVETHKGFRLRLLGPSEFAYLDLNGRFALQLETESPVELETTRGEWKMIA